MISQTATQNTKQLRRHLRVDSKVVLFVFSANRVLSGPKGRDLGCFGRRKRLFGAQRAANAKLGKA